MQLLVIELKIMASELELREHGSKEEDALIISLASSKVDFLPVKSRI